MPRSRSAPCPRTAADRPGSRRAHRVPRVARARRAHDSQTWGAIHSINQAVRMQEVTGNTTGLRPAQVKMLERVYRRRVAPADVVGPDLATFLCEISTEIGRQVGILIDRRG